jgi:AraC-like DNA-binding protein
MKPSTQPPEYIQYELLDKLKQALEIEMQYIDHNLTISLLSKELHTNREYLSSTINHFYGENYTNFINEYRVKPAIQLFEDISNDKAKNCTMFKIVNTVGFKSTSTFNPALKRFWGLHH